MSDDCEPIVDEGEAEIPEANDERFLAVARLAYRMGRKDGTRMTLRRVRNVLGPGTEAMVLAVLPPDVDAVDFPSVVRAALWDPEDRT